MQQPFRETSTIPCNLCGKSDVSVLAMRSRSGVPLRSVICKQCGLVWSDPFPHNPRHFYEEDYRLAYKNTYSPKTKHILRAGKIALERYDKIKNWLDKPQRILDVGTGGGEFAYLLKTLGHDLQGIEPNKGYADYSVAEYGLNLQIGFIQDSQFSDESFDLITIWHVLEHTEDPCFALTKLRNLIKPQGLLVVEVPNIESKCQSPKSTFHEAHLFNFNLATLRKMGEKVGLIEVNHSFSDDEGNITIFFRKSQAEILKAYDGAIPGNANHVIAVINDHTHWKHYLSKAPYLRFLRRLFRSASELITLKSFDNNKTILDQLYQSCHSD